MSKNVVLAALILSIAIVSSTWMHARMTRFQIVSSSQAIATRLDRSTGATSLITAGEVLNREEKTVSHKDSRVLPKEEIQDIEVYGHTTGDQLSGMVHNGTQWVLDTIEIRADGTVIPESQIRGFGLDTIEKMKPWTTTLRTDVSTGTMRTSRFSSLIFGNGAVNVDSCTVLAAWGHKE